MNRSRKRVRTPTVLQVEAVECGAACLKIVLAHYGRVVPLAELRDRCGICRDGVTAGQLKQVAEALGLQVRAFRCSADHLLEAGSCPAILYWSFNHFLVLEGFERGRAYLNDPACGRRSVDWETFRAGFTGVVLEPRPGERFEPGGREPSPWRWLPALVAPYRNLLPWIALTAVIGSLPELFIAAATSQIIDAVLEEGRQTIAIPALWISAIALVVLLTVLMLQKLLLRRLGIRVLKRIGGLIHVALFSLPYRYAVRRSRGELASRLLLPLVLVRLSLNGVVDVLLSLTSGMLALLVGLLISPWLTLITLGISGGNAALTLWMRQGRRDDNISLAMAQGNANGAAVHTLQGIESIKASGLEHEAFMHWSASFGEVIGKLQQQSLTVAVQELVGNSSGLLLRCSVVLVGGGLILLGQLTLGELTAFQFLIGMLQTPLQQLSLLSSQLQQLDGQMARFNDVVDTPVDPAVRSFALSAVDRHAPEPSRQHKLHGALRLIDVGYRSSATAPWLLADIDLQLEAGSHLAIVGASGSGKSTLLRLIAGLERPSQGAIQIDGCDWMDWDDARLRASIALVSQEVFVCDASLAENLTLWDPRLSRSAALRALAETELLDELGGAKALDLQLGEAGCRLSGGQRQRVEIARALLRQPTLLLLDEATSALDDRGEEQILAAIKRRPLTLVTVAHRLRSAQISDWVVVLEQGRLIEQGPPLALARSGGAYSRLLQAEAGRFGEVGS